MSSRRPSPVTRPGRFRRLARLRFARRARKQAREVVTAGEVMLTGGAVDLLLEKGPVPAWARLNRVAHGDGAQLRALASYHPIWTDWEGVTVLLATEVVEMAGDEPGGIVRVQRECLVPLELELLTPSHGERISPGRLLAEARERLRAHPWAGRIRR